ncbi:MAG: molybdopterin converting factor subunit 1 [Rhodoferax sp.]|jgi:molybdopterin synthase sulfur carrier subunit|nr:molybdopterin converting factor subunit 1 [Rhodoferax sp.]
MQVQVRYFASIREAIGTGGETVDTDAADVQGLRDALMARSPAHAQALARGRAVRVAMNQVMCAEDALLAAGVEVAFFPPVTGG